MLEIQKDEIDQSIVAIKDLSSKLPPYKFRRVCLIDGCNFLSKMGTVMHDIRNPTFKGSIAAVSRNDTSGPNARAALYLVHDMLKMGFEVMFVIKSFFMEEKGHSPENTMNRYVLTKLKEIGILSSFPDEVDDDEIILMHAKRLGGFVISNDRYSQEKYNEYDEVRHRTIRFHHGKNKGFARKDIYPITGRFLSNVDIYLDVSQREFFKIAYCSPKNPMFPTVKHMQNTLNQEYQQRRIEICGVIEDFHRMELCIAWYNDVSDENPGITMECDYFNLLKAIRTPNFTEFYNMYEVYKNGQDPAMS